MTNSIFVRSQVTVIAFLIAFLSGQESVICQKPGATPSFTYTKDGFFLNGEHFQFWSGEMHFQRIPRANWRDRLYKAKAMGLNTVATYVFWNALEPQPGVWDFEGANDLGAFLDEAKSLGLYVIVRPGPYACAEWDLGGLPAWLLAVPDIKLRSSDPRYLDPALDYVKKIAKIVKPRQIQNGGTVIMVQVENEYGSYGNDKRYMETLRDTWLKAGIDVPLSTSDGATPYMLEAGALKGCVIGLDPGANAADFEAAKKANPEVPAFCAEYYPGWLTHWGEPWAHGDSAELLRDVEWLIQHKKSWNLYVLHGGTNWGFYAGANMADAYQPDITSYDYGAPIREDGSLTPRYFALQSLLQRYLPAGTELPPVILDSKTAFNLEIPVRDYCSVFNHLPPAKASVQPKPMEMYGQNFGFILYRTELVGHHKGKLVLTDVHDYANIYLDGKFIGTLDRTKKQNTLELPEGKILDILVEGMGRINFSQHLHDRKGITDRVTLNGMTLMQWEVFNLPMETPYIAALSADNATPWQQQPGKFFKGSFTIDDPADTYLDMSEWKKGVVWVNGVNLGRYWEVGPQKRLFCPAHALKKGENSIVVFDLQRLEGAIVKTAVSLD